MQSNKTQGVGHRNFSKVTTVRGTLDISYYDKVWTNTVLCFAASYEKSLQTGVAN